MHIYVKSRNCEPSSQELGCLRTGETVQLRFVGRQHVHESQQARRQRPLCPAAVQDRRRRFPCQLRPAPGPRAASPPVVRPLPLLQFICNYLIMILNNNESEFVISNKSTALTSYQSVRSQITKIITFTIKSCRIQVYGIRNCPVRMDRHASSLATWNGY